MPEDEKKPLGKILLKRKLVSAKQLESALTEQKKLLTPVPLASQLVEDGTVPEDGALLALSEQHGIPAVDATHIVIDTVHLDMLPRAAAETLKVLPLSVEGDTVLLAMADPANKKAVDEIEFATGKTVRPRVALHTALVAAIAAAYDARRQGAATYRGPNAPADACRASAAVGGVKGPR